MTTPAHYPYSTTYLWQHMAHLSRGIVVGGLAFITAVVVIGAAAAVLQALP